jgi:hypothetical protein
VTRVLADGSAYDSAYGSAGLGHANWGGYSASPIALALDSDGRAVVAGQYWSDSSHPYFAVARFQCDTATLGSLTTRSAATVVASPINAPSPPEPTLLALALDSPDLWEVIRPPARRRG